MPGAAREGGPFSMLDDWHRTGVEGFAMTKTTRSEAAAILGRAGGKARAKALTAEERSKIGKKGARKRWGAKRRKKVAKMVDAKDGGADNVGEAASVTAVAKVGPRVGRDEVRSAVSGVR